MAIRCINQLSASELDGCLTYQDGRSLLLGRHDGHRRGYGGYKDDFLPPLCNEVMRAADSREMRKTRSRQFNCCAKLSRV